MSLARTATLDIPTPSSEAAQRVVAALAVEADDGPEGTHVTLAANAAVVRITVTAEDTRGLRNASSSILRLAQIAVDLEAAEPL